MNKNCNCGFENCACGGWLPRTVAELAALRDEFDTIFRGLSPAELAIIQQLGVEYCNFARGATPQLARLKVIGFALARDAVASEREEPRLKQDYTPQ